MGAMLASSTMFVALSALMPCLLWNKFPKFLASRTNAKQLRAGTRSCHGGPRAPLSTVFSLLAMEWLPLLLRHTTALSHLSILYFMANMAIHRGGCMIAIKNCCFDVRMNHRRPPPQRRA
ncbi:hypothetical protein BC830DRAFT_1098980 [Chytriomyces sp. MP71]|nr:hypothetical protein BC830DRAFT_1098980 [Chytriomyces sp. MP71]